MKITIQNIIFLFLQILDGPYSTEKLRKLTVRPTVSLIDIGQYLDNDRLVAFKEFEIFFN